MAKKKKEYLSIVKKSWHSEPEIKVFDRMHKATTATVIAIFLIAEELKKKGHNVIIENYEDATIQCRACPHYVIGHIESREVG